MYCKYYQSQVLRKKTWFLSAVFRNESNLTFARALEDSENNIWEFFVPQDQEEQFLKILNSLKEKSVVVSFEKKKNRLS